MQPNKLFCNGLNIAPQDGWALSFTPFPKRNTSRAISTLQTQYTSLFSNCKQIYTHCAQIIWCILQLQQPKSNCCNLCTQPLVAGVPSFCKLLLPSKKGNNLCVVAPYGVVVVICTCPLVSLRPVDCIYPTKFWIFPLRKVPCTFPATRCIAWVCR